MAKDFIIIEPDPIVSMDLEGTLSQQFHDCRVVVETRLDVVVSKLRGCGPETTLFVKSGLLKSEDHLKSAVQHAVTRGTRVVTLGPVENWSTPTASLELPFTAAMVIAAVDPSEWRGVDTASPETKQPPTAG